MQSGSHGDHLQITGRMTLKMNGLNNGLSEGAGPV
jgi:hypothetical protein